MHLHNSFFFMKNACMDYQLRDPSWTVTQRVGAIDLCFNLWVDAKIFELLLKLLGSLTMYKQLVSTNNLPNPWAPSSAVASFTCSSSLNPRSAKNVLRKAIVLSYPSCLSGKVPSQPADPSAVTTRPVCNSKTPMNGSQQTAVFLKEFICYHRASMVAAFIVIM